MVTGAGLAWQLAAGSTAPGDPRQYDADVALLQFTSGTTGAPKPVPLRHATVLDLIDRLLHKLRNSSNAAQPKGKRAPMPNLVPLSLSLWAGI
nr:acyl-CoA synthetase [Mycolicibacter nonchromogenicus]